MFGKKKQKEVPERQKGILGIGKDYRVYHMTRKDYLTAWGIGFGAGLAVLYVFFNHLLAALLGGVICAKLLPKYYRDYQKQKQLNELRSEFRDLLESLTGSYSSGSNTADSFRSSLNDMVSIYGEDADIVREVKLICTGLQNNINIEVLLLDFAKRSGLDDVMSFANVFEVCNRQGGDLKKIVADTREIINDKIEVEMEIETMISGAQNELNIMMVMPLIVVVMIRGLGSGTFGADSPAAFLVNAVCLGIFGFAYVLGRKITDIKI